MILTVLPAEGGSVLTAAGSRRAVRRGGHPWLPFFKNQKQLFFVENNRH